MVTTILVLHVFQRMIGCIEPLNVSGCRYEITITSGNSTDMNVTCYYSSLLFIIVITHKCLGNHLFYRSMFIHSNSVISVSVSMIPFLLPGRSFTVK